MGKGKQLILAVVLFFGALLANKFYLDQQEANLSPSKLVTIVRAKKQIPAGTPLNSSLYEKKEIPQNFVPLSAIKYADIQQYEGQELSVDVQAGDYIVENYFSTHAAVGKTLSEQVEGDNARAITIPVDETNSLSRSVVSGDKIDILLTFNVPRLNQKMSTILFQNVPVIATGSYSVVEQEVGTRGGAQRRYNTVTLKLGANEAFRLNYAREVGKISILLRNKQDNGVLNIEPISGVTDFLSGAEKEVLERLVSQAQPPVPTDEKFKAQVKEIFEQKRLQAGGNR